MISFSVFFFFLLFCIVMYLFGKKQCILMSVTDLLVIFLISRMYLMYVLILE